MTQVVLCWWRIERTGELCECCDDALVFQTNRNWRYTIENLFLNDVLTQVAQSFAAGMLHNRFHKLDEAFGMLVGMV